MWAGHGGPATSPSLPPEPAPAASLRTPSPDSSTPVPTPPENGYTEHHQDKKDGPSHPESLLPRARRSAAQGFPVSFASSDTLCRHRKGGTRADFRLRLRLFGPSPDGVALVDR